MKFKMSKIAAAVVTVGAIGSAQAVTVNPDRTGQVLILPYYNVNNNFVTNFEIVNTKDEYKIIKVRLREGGNSQDVLDFNIYMSPFDVWKGVIRHVERTDSEGNTVIRANLTSADNSCTLPASDASLTINGVPGMKLNSSGWDMNVLYPDVTDADAREGYIEIIEVGTIDPNTYVDMDGDGATNGNNDQKLTDGIKHGTDGKPADCSVIAKAWTNGTTNGASASGAAVNNWGSYAPDSVNYVGDSDADAALDAPGGGLYAFEVLLNASSGSAFVADATAIDHYSTKSQHYRPGDPVNFLLPSLASGDVQTTLVPVAASDSAAILNWPLTIDATLNDGDSNTPRSGVNPLPIAHVLQAKAVMNSYFIKPEFDGATEAVLTFPMKKHGIFNGKWHHGLLQFDDNTGEYVCSDTDPNNPPSNAVGAATVGTGTTEGENVCFQGRDKDVEVTVQVWDFEEQTIKQEDPGFTVSPVIEPQTKKTVLSREVNVVTFADTGSSILGASERTNINPGVDFTAGWFQIDFANKCLQETDLADGTVGSNFLAAAPTQATCGVPVIGFTAVQGRDFNIQAGTFFGETIEHRYMRDVSPTATP